MRTYIVQPGDTLSAIARDQLGDITKWPALAQANSLANPDVLSVGQVLQLPDLVMTVDQGSTAPAPAPAQSEGMPTWAKLGVAASIVGAGVALYKARKKKKKLINA